jgi:hypothetical protein
VDLTQITELRFSINPATGNYLGTVFIDYIQIGGPAPSLPNITIDSPTNGSTIPTSTTITASTTSSNIQSVTFFDGTTALSVDVTPPYLYNWTNASLGPHTLTAVIHTNNGIANTSAQVIVTVAAPEINIKQGTTYIASGDTYNFGNVQNSTSSGPITFTIENTGDYALNLTGSPSKIILSGADASQFSINETSTSATVPATGGITTFTVTFNPTSPGTKSATITIPNDDANESSYTINLTGTAVVGSAYEPLLNNNIEVFPNPVTEQVIITLKGLRDEVRYYLLDPFGSVLLSGTTIASPDGTSERIDMTSLAMGTYYVQIITDKSVGVKKIMKY